MNFSDEQLAVISASRSGAEPLKVLAFAGAGKTTTLVGVAEANRDKRILYVAFNRSVADEAQGRFPVNVQAKTAHSLAFGWAVRHIRDLQSRLNLRMNGGFVAEKLALRNVGYKIDGNEVIMSARAFGAMVLDAFDRWCRTMDDKPEPGHVWHESFPMIGNEAADKLRDAASEAARKLRERIERDSSMPLTHDYYLRKFAVEGTPLASNYDMIMLDEAQDGNAVMLEMLKRASQAGAQIIMVGDPYQRIYSWRGAKNGFTAMPGQELRLTGTYRFGEEIADIASDFLAKHFKETARIRGLGPGREDGRTAILCRTNAGVLSAGIEQMDYGKPVYATCAGEILALCEAAQDLKRGNPRGPFALFKDWQQMVEHSESEAGADLAVFVKLVDKYGLSELQYQANRMKINNPNAVTVSTMHKAKGLEWDRVRIHNDAYPGRDNVNDELLRLYYVAMTRAKRDLDASAIKMFLPEHGIIQSPPQTEIKSGRAKQQKEEALEL